MNIKQVHIVWAVLAVIAVIFLNRRYPFATSPLWFWNKPFRNTENVEYQAPGYGSTDPDFD